MAGAGVKVLHVMEPVAGGTRRHLIDVVRHTPDTEHHVALPRRWIRGAGEPTATALYDAGAELHLVDLRRNPFHPAAIGSAVTLRRLIRRVAPDVVHSHSSIAGAVARSCVASSVPVASVYTAHALAAGRPALALERLLGRRRTDCFVALSTSEASQVLALGLVPADRIRVIPNGIDLEPTVGPVIDVRGRLGLEAGTALVGCVARLVPQKAPEHFVRACAAVARSRPDAHFLLVGHGRLQRLVDEEVRRWHLGDRFHQIEDLPDAGALLGQLDVLVLSSRFEGGPYAPLEAMRAGVPVILTDVVGNRDVVEHGVSGLLVPFGDTDAMAAGVVRLLQDAGLRAAMVTAAIERLRTHFDVRHMGRALGQLYRDLLSSHSSWPGEPREVPERSEPAIAARGDGGRAA